MSTTHDKEQKIKKGVLNANDRFGWEIGLIICMYLVSAHEYD